MKLLSGGSSSATTPDMRAFPTFLALALLASIAAAAQSAPATPPATSAPAPPALPSPAELESGGYRIGQVHLDLGEIFDERKPGERKFLFRLANRLHRTTRPSVVQPLLLFRPGDPYSQARIAESERLLRAERWFYDAKIRPVKVDGDKVDLEVATRDVWSLTPGLQFRRTGGANTTSFKVQDTNLLGLGKNLEFRYQSNVDRNETFGSYLDRNLFGSDARLELEAGDASDGREGFLLLQRPFSTLETRWAASLQLGDSRLVDSLYELGHVSDRFQSRRRSLELWAGWSAGREGKRTTRFTTGFTWDRNLFEAPPAGFDPVNGRIPAERELVYPWVGWERIDDRFVVERDLDKIERSEDLNLGAQVSARVGFAPKGWGTNDNQAIVTARFRDGAELGPRNLFLVAADLDGRVGNGGAEDLLASVTLRDYFSDFRHGRLVFALRLQAAHELALDHQLLLGGDTGLRGYPLRFEQGDRLVLATIEQRLYRDHEYFHLVRVGAAAFVDVGKVWFDDKRDAVGRQDAILRDLGIGLRIGSSRSARAAMVHLDLAMPLDGPKTISRLQWLVTTGDTF